MPNGGEVIVITDDIIFAQMIVLELKREKINASVLRLTEIPRSSRGIFIADADCIGDTALERLIHEIDKIIIFSYEDRPESGESGKVIWLRRPFETEKLLSVISDMLNGKKSSYVSAALPPDNRELILRGNGSVNFCGKSISLTKREYELLEYLYKNRGRAVSRDEAVTNVWKYEFTGNTNVVDVYIRYLREKIDDQTGTKLIYTVRNKGYMIK
ncbi:MAG: winged-helix domain-containing protein [Eubacteriales bacterium]|jgi:two-component system response regulator ArlR|nr:winged-helix domain-containing protein [Eubacteriales bacterium]